MADVIRIDDPDDPRIAAFRDIRERDLVGREGRFIAEGRVVLNVLLAASSFEPEAVLLLENRLAGLADLLARVPEAAPIYVAGQTVMDRIAGFHLHRGILAVGRRGEEPGPAELLGVLPRRTLVVALAGISNHDNIGAIFRNAASFGAGAVLLDPECCDPLYRKAIRVSVGAALKVPFARAASLDGLVSGLRDASFDIVALSPRGMRDLRDVRPGPRTALLLGTEGAGLPPDLLERVGSVRIGMAADFDSLNVAAASAIALERLWRG